MGVGEEPPQGASLQLYYEAGLLGGEGAALASLQLTHPQGASLYG